MRKYSVCLIIFSLRICTGTVQFKVETKGRIELRSEIGIRIQ